MKPQDTARLSERKARIDSRLDPSWQVEAAAPMLSGANTRYEVSARVQAIPYGGIGLVHELVRRLGLAESIDRHLHVFKRHFPYHESDHVLNLAYNVMVGGGTDARLIPKYPFAIDSSVESTSPSRSRSSRTSYGGGNICQWLLMYFRGRGSTSVDM